MGQACVVYIHLNICKFSIFTVAYCVCDGCAKLIATGLCEPDHTTPTGIYQPHAVLDNKGVDYHIYTFWL